MDLSLRNKLRNVVTQCRRLLEDAVSQELQGKFGIYATGRKDAVQIDDEARLSLPSEEDRAARKDILDHYEHIEARGFQPKEALDQLVREIAFTHLNRLCAYKMMEARQVYVGGQKFREAISRGVNSNGVKFYLAEHPEDERLFNTGQQELAYRHFLDWLGGTLSEEIGVLFSPNDPANRLYPPQRVLDQVLDLLNGGDIKPEETDLREAWPKIWAEDETIGWVYQYFTPKELRDKARKESQAPRNSYELAFRNQFFTPRYVVGFLTDNTLGRIWYEMRKGHTKLRDQCRYLVRRPDEVFLSAMAAEGHEHFSDECGQIARLLQDGDEAAFPPFTAADEQGSQRMIELAHCVNAYETKGEDWATWFSSARERIEGGDFSGWSTQDLLDYLFLTCRADRFGGDGSVYSEPWFANVANEVRHRTLTGREADATQEQLLKSPQFILHREKKDPRELKILDPACGSGHFLLYCFDLLQTIYEEAYSDPDLGPALQQDYPTLDDLRRAVPRLILARNLHGIDIDLRSTQIAALALWLRCQRAWQDIGLKQDRYRITRSNIVCAEPMPGEEGLLDEFLKTLHEDRLEKLIRRVLDVPEDKRVRATPEMADRLCELVRAVWDKMKLAGEAGSLLKIEEELQEAIRRGERESAEEQPLFRLIDYGLTDEPQEKLIRFVRGEVLEFWERAEALVMAALDDFAEYAANGRKLLRKLFVDDAMRGFAFVDVCRQRFDVILMNPPFGEASKPSKVYIEAEYPRTKNDVYATFVERGLELLQPHSMVGAITSRTGFFLSSFRKWREELLLERATPTVFADFGFGVLDALVETAAYCLSTTSNTSAVFLRLLANEDKASGLSTAIDRRKSGQASSAVYDIDPDSLRGVPGSPFAYWIETALRRLFAALPSFEGNGRSVKAGLCTGDDFQFIRTCWEVPQTQILNCVTAGNEPHRNLQRWCREQLRHGMRWVFFAKGGEYSPYYSDIHLVVDWEDDGQRIRTGASDGSIPGARPQNVDCFFRPGLTWPLRSTSGFGLRIVPQGVICGHKGPAIFFENSDDALLVLGALFSQCYQRLLEVSLAAGEETQSGTASRSYEVGLIQRLPWPEFSHDDSDTLSGHVCTLIDAVRQQHASDENARLFCRPVFRPATTLKDATIEWQRNYERSVVQSLEDAAAVETLVQQALRLPTREVKSLTTGDARSLCDLPSRELRPDFKNIYCRGIHETIREQLDQGGGNRQIAVKSYYLSRRLEVLAQALKVHPAHIASVAAADQLLPDGVLRETAEQLISYSVGCVTGRWDIRIATEERPESVLPSPLAAIPPCAPGVLQTPEGLPARPGDVPDDYPLRIDWDGILVEDSEHQDDIVRRTREVLEVIWKDRAEAIEQEACEILGVKAVRDYFRKPAKGGFWDDHVKRYSKSRRKAPLYWLLQSSKKNYALWLYYHRLDKDLLFKALMSYVEPKIRLEENRLDSLRSQKAAAGESGKGGRQLDRDAEKQEDLLSELRDFEDKLRRAANLHLVPDLNDGVVLNIAPLHELVPWKEARKYWEELLDGKYEWSTIGKHLREKGLVK